MPLLASSWGGKGWIGRRVYICPDSVGNCVIPSDLRAQIDFFVYIASLGVELTQNIGFQIFRPPKRKKKIWFWIPPPPPTTL